MVFGHGFDSRLLHYTVRDKCGMSELKVGAGKIVPKLKSKKELAVLDAFRHFGMIE